MGLGSWARFILGIILSAGIIWGSVTGDNLGNLMLLLSVLYIALTGAWVAKKFIPGL